MTNSANIANSANWYTQPGYKNLLVYKLAVIIFDLTSEFCAMFIEKVSRTFDQMIQAVRSGKQNIVEGSLEKSLKSYIKLLGVARASFEELLEDLRDFLRLKNLPLWKKDDLRVQKIRSFRVGENPNSPNLANMANWANLPNCAESYANFLITLISLETYLLDKLIKTLEEKFIREGGYSENLTKKRVEYKLAKFAKYGKLAVLVLFFAEFGLFGKFAKPALATNTGRFTISVWVNPTTSIASKAIIAKAEELRLVTDASGNPLCQFKTTTWQTAATSSSAIPLSTWSHIICTYDLTNIKIYVNGVQKGSTALTAVPDDTSAIFYAGRDASASTTYGFFSGAIDEYKFYNYNLSLDEILTDYNRGSALVLGSLSTGSSNPASSSAGSQEYCVPGDTTTNCSPPVGRWDFNEGVGSSVFDTSGSGNVGSWNGTGTHWGTGKIGKAGKFNGTSDWMSVADSASLDVSAEATFEAWLYPTSFASHKSAYEKNSAYMLYLGTGVEIAGQKSFRPHVYTTTWRYGSINFPGVENTWYHVAYTYVASTGTMKGYVNGVEYPIVWSSAPVAGENINNSTTPLKIAGTDRGVSTFSGLIDQVRIYNYARTPSQIAWDYSWGDPITYYQFNKCQGTTLNDSMNLNHATIYIGATGTQSAPGTCAAGIGSTAAWGVGSTGKYNASLNFDGTDDYTATANVALLAGAGQSAPGISYGAWVYPTSSAVSKTIINKGNEFKLETDTNSKANCSIYKAGAWQTASISSSAIPLSSWTHVLCVYDGTNTIVYINGLSSGTQSTTGSILSLSSTALSIARDPTPSQYFSGQIDEVKVWNYPLTATQVKNEFNQGSGVRFGPVTGVP